MEHKCTRERFLGDIKDHKMEIIKEDGVYRHIVFKRPNSNTYRFELITWPGYLSLTGDMGCYVFSRIEDMFGFFIMGEGDFNAKSIINPDYWEEKLQSISKFGSREGIRDFSPELFEQNIKEYFDNYFEDRGSEDSEKEAVLSEIEYDILAYKDDAHPQELMRKVYDFREGNFYFDDFSFDSCYEYTMHYIWICYAIVWGILEYNKNKEVLS